jgi:hypothetical protein
VVLLVSFSKTKRSMESRVQGAKDSRIQVVLLVLFFQNLEAKKPRSPPTRETRKTRETRETKEEL